MSWHPNKRGKGWLMFDREYNSKRNLRPKREFKRKSALIDMIVVFANRGCIDKSELYLLRAVYGSKY